MGERQPPIRRVLPYGEHGVLVECPDLADALGMLRALHERCPAEVAEIVPGARTVFLRLTRPLTPALRDHLVRLDTVADRDTTDDVVVVGVRYDGADLAQVAELVGLSPAEVVTAHTEQRWTVGFCGFAPGFGYLQGEHDRLRVPRRATPRTAVPAGAVGLADVWSGIYPRRGPGGWQLIGRTERVLWDPDRRPPALLQPGTIVRFVDEDA